MFFVLSGYLITSIITEGLESGKFTFREFYLRRIQRLLPNLIAVLIAVTAASACLLPKGTAQTHGLHALWTAFNVSNIFIWKNLGGYWGVAAETAPLTHTWSLAVEEQFYLLYPVVLVLVWRARIASVKWMLAVAWLISFVLCMIITKKIASAAFYFLPTRGWELLAGALLAMPIRRRTATHPVVAGAMGWAGIAMLFSSFVLLNERSHFPGYVALWPVVGSVLLILSVETSASAVSHVLSSRPAIAIGKASYSLYLWHWPCIVFARILAVQREWPQQTAVLVGVAGGMIGGVLAYHFIETPLRYRGSGRKSRLALIAAGSLCAVLAASWLSLRPLRADLYSRFEPIMFSARAYDTLWSSADYQKEKPQGHAYDVSVPRLLEEWPRHRWREGGVIRLHGSSEPPKVVVFGSSHAQMYGRIIEELCREKSLPVAFFAVTGGGPAMFEATADPSSKEPFASHRDAAEFDAVRRRFLEKWSPELVILLDRWDSKYTPDKAETRMREFLTLIGQQVGTVAFVAQVPAHIGGNYVNLREVVSSHVKSAMDPLPPLFPDRKDGLRKQIAERMETLRSEFPQLSVVRPDLKFYRSDGSILYAEGRSFFYMDEDHLSDAGAARVRDLFGELIRMATTRPSAAR